MNRLEGIRHDGLQGYGHQAPSGSEIPHSDADGEPGGPVCAFAALTGYEEAVEEAHRLTDHRPELSEEENDALDRALQQALEEKEKPVTITRFIPDAWKEGGSIVAKKGRIRRLDAYRRRLVMEDGEKIPLGEVLELKREEN